MITYKKKAMPGEGRYLLIPCLIKASYFADCERDDAGHCLPSGQQETSKPDKPRSSSSTAQGRDSSEQDTAANRPSRPEERHKGASPKGQPWVPSPPKKGKTGTGPIQRPKGDASQTKLGDHTEELARSLGFRNILPAGKRNFTAAEVKKMGSSIDLEYDHSGRAYELKMCKTTSTEYRLKAKKEEKVAKLKYARKNKLKVYTLIGVRDEDSGEVFFYASRQPGLTGVEVNERDFDYLGSVRF